MVLYTKAATDKDTQTNVSYMYAGRWASNPLRRKDPTQGSFLFREPNPHVARPVVWQGVFHI